MPYRYRPDLSGLSPDQRDVAIRLITGSNTLYREFAAAMTCEEVSTNAKVAKLIENNFKRFVGRVTHPALQEPDYLRLPHNQPINLQQSQKPKFAFIGCVDSRVDPTTLLAADIGEVLPHRKVALAIERPDDTDEISVDTAGYLAMAVEVMKTPNIVIMPHGKCGGIQKAAEYTNVQRPEKFGEGLMWDMLQTKRNIFQNVRDKGAEFYLNRLDIHDRNNSPHDRFLQAVEIADSVRVTRKVNAMVRKLEGGDNVTVSTVYMDLRTLNPHLLINAENDDWKLLRLTGHPKLPCTHVGGAKIDASNDNTRVPNDCSCRPNGKMFTRLFGNDR